jgi:peptidoglycan/xylan/chitin deacetylase (PgdA/CDA1 family)
VKKKIIGAVLGVVVIITVVLVVTRLPGEKPSSNYLVGVWNNAEFSKPAEEWSDAAISLGGEDGVVDLVVAQAHGNGLVYLPFPFQNTGFLYSTTATDLAETYLSEFETAGLKVILSIQPLEADIKQLIGIILSRYSNHDNILGINVDIEWKESGTPNHVSNQERDAWLSEIKKYNSSYKLFITYFQDYTHFPGNHPDLVVLYDGEADTQTYLLKEYQELAKHYSSVGIYTGYSSTVPPAASNEQIMSAAPNTGYILHTYDVFDDRRIVIFQLDDVQADWLESISMRLIETHIEKKVPVLCAVLPNMLDQDVGQDLAIYLKDVNDDYPDLVEIGQHGYTHNITENFSGMNYEQQESIISTGYQILVSVGITPVSFIPPYGSVDNTTVEVTEKLGFHVLCNPAEDATIGLSSNTTHNMSILDNYIELTARENWSPSANVTIKTAEQIMGEIDQNEGSGPVVILYHIQDFQRDTNDRLLQVANTLEALKDSGKYLFLTATQYEVMVGEGEQAAGM